MKKLFLILFVALATCAEIEEFDDNVVLEKSKTIPTVRHTSKITVKHTTKIPTTKVTTKVPTTKVTTKVPTTKVTTKVPTTKVTTKVPTTKVTTKIPTTKVTTKLTTKFTTGPTTKIPPKKTVKDLMNLPIKGVNGLFKGKVGEFFRKLGEAIKRGIAWLKQNNLWNPIIEQLQKFGTEYGNELCQKALPEEVCGPAVDFAVQHLLKTDEKN